jgi:hypothetical protein
MKIPLADALSAVCISASPLRRPEPPEALHLSGNPYQGFETSI